MGRVIRAARNRHVQRLYMSCLAENARMQAIARHHEASLRFDYGEVVGEILPKARLAVMTSDTAGDAKAATALVHAMESHAVDILVGVLVMGLVVQQIERAFATSDTDRLQALRG